MTAASRRQVLLGVGAGLGAALVAGPAMADEFTRPHKGFAPPNTRLKPGSPRSVGLRSGPIEEAKAAVRSHLVAPPGGFPLYSGAVGLMAHDGVVVAVDVSGHALRYADATTELPEAQKVPMRRDTIFDLASVSKLFTSLAVVQLIEEGEVELEEPVATYLADFAVNGKEQVTIRQLLTHTSGFTSWLPLWSRYPDPESRIAAVLAAALANEPGSTYLYSDLNLITLGVLVERLRGQSLDDVVRERITAPLRMDDTGYNPADRDRTAATEYQVSPPRGMVRGEVHDENAWSLGGVAGHAGVFSTVDDLAVLAQCLLNGGIYAKRRILAKRSVELLITDFNPEFPADAHGLGFEIDQRWYMDALSGVRTVGHTGYTGTSLVIDFASRSIVILLTNRVHPSRLWGSNNVARREWARGLAMAMPVRPARGDTAWFATNANSTISTLSTADLPVGSRGRVSFDLFLDTEETDLFRLEHSADAGATWTTLPLVLRDRGETWQVDGPVSGSGTRHWYEVRADLPPGTGRLRWSYTTDETVLGRGVAIDDVLVRGRGVLLDGEKHPEALTAEGWVLRGRGVVA